MPTATGKPTSSRESLGLEGELANGGEHQAVEDFVPAEVGQLFGAAGLYARSQEKTRSVRDISAGRWNKGKKIEDLKLK